MPQGAPKPKPVVLEDRVIILHDTAWIADHTNLYINPLYDLTDEQVVAITNEIVWSTGFHIEVLRISLDDLFAQKVPLSRSDRLNYMAGRPLWRLPAMFVSNGRGRNRKSPVGIALREVMAIQAVFGKAVIKGALEIQYGRLRNRLPQGQGYARAEIHAGEFMEHALGQPRFWNLDGDLIEERAEIVSRAAQNKPTQKFMAIMCNTFGSAETIARNVIDKPDKKGAFGPIYRDSRPHIYLSAIARIGDEILHSRQAFGFELDGIAIGAWYHRVVTALRLGASVFKELDKARDKVAKKMFKANTEYQRLLRSANLTDVDKQNVERLRSLIAEEARLFDAKIGSTLAEVDGKVGEEANSVYRCIEPLDAAIIAFYGGVNARSTVPGICSELSQWFQDVLESLVWLGHLQRHRTRVLDCSNARTFLNAIADGNGDTPKNLVVRHCLELGMSFLNDADRVALLAAITEVAATGDPRTVTLSLQDFTPADPEIADVAAAEIRDQEQLQDVLWDEPTTYHSYNPELGMYQNMFPELELRSTFISLPPFYRTDWAGWWRVERDKDDDFFVGAVRAKFMPNF